MRDHDPSRSWTFNQLSHPCAPRVRGFCFVLFCFLKSICFLRERERETELKQGKGREREGNTESEAGSGLGAVSTEPDVGFEAMSCEIVT